jgi:hypothetical protein
MVNVYVITSIYAFEEAEKLTEAMVGVDARTRPGVNASHESELMVGAEAWTKPAIKCNGARDQRFPSSAGPLPPPCTSLTSLPGVLSLRTKKNKSQRPANARHEQMTEMQGQHFSKNRHNRVQKSDVFASKWLQLRSERLNNVRLCSTRPQSQILGRQAVQH